MDYAKKISRLLRNLLVYGVVFLDCTFLAISQDLLIADSNKVQSAFQSKTNQNKISYLDRSANFYKTDSIFSLQSSKGYFPSLLNNFEEQATAPLTFKKKEWIITGAAVGITTSLILIDNDIDEWARVQKQKHSWVNKSSPFITKFSSNYGIYSAIAIGSLSAVFKNKKGFEISLLATQAMFTSGIWVHMIKLLTGRERPEADYIFSKSEGGKWYGPFTKFDQDLAFKKPGSSFDSFPSGHTATAFSIATVFTSQYKDIKVIPVLCYSATTLVGISRLTEHQHWVSDVFVGGLLGYACGKQVVAHYNKTHQNPGNSLSSKSKNKTELTLIQDENQIGLFLKW